MTPLALRYMGDGEFRALHPRLADKALVIGEVHRWEIVSDRSADSHRHYFAVLNEAWQNLPEALAMDFPSPEHLRKWGLIQSGYCNMTKMEFRTNDDSVKAADVMQAMDNYNIFLPTGSVKIGDLDYALESNSMFDLVKRMEEIPLHNEQGNFSFLKDVADPKDASFIQSNVVRVNGRSIIEHDPIEASHAAASVERSPRATGDPVMSSSRSSSARVAFGDGVCPAT